jgi:hypothetical protein
MLHVSIPKGIENDDPCGQNMWHFINANIAFIIKYSFIDENYLYNFLHETQRDIMSKDNECVLSTLLFKEGMSQLTLMHSII